MTPKSRLDTALRGGKPDIIPIVTIYDMGYISTTLGQDIRAWRFHTAAERIETLEAIFLRHQGIDGIFQHAGTNDAAAARYQVEKLPKFWRIHDRETGEVTGLLPDGSACTPDGMPLPKQGDDLYQEPLIQCEADIERIYGPTPTPEFIEAGGRFSALRYMVQKYPDHHFSFQSGTPMVGALNESGGYVAGLTTMAGNPALFKKILERNMEHTIAYIQAGARAGGHSTWFTCYYTGADTISPRDYADIVFPYEYEVCKAAKEAGVFVLNWYLGDLMPNLEQVMQLPMDALVLEQGRKGYDIDPVAIRKQVGPNFCLFGFGFENDYCTFNRQGLTTELQRQIDGAGMDGAFVIGTPIMPPNANPDAVDYYIGEGKRLGKG